MNLQTKHLAIATENGFFLLISLLEYASLLFGIHTLICILKMVFKKRSSVADHPSRLF